MKAYAQSNLAIAACGDDEVDTVPMLQVGLSHMRQEMMNGKEEQQNMLNTDPDQLDEELADDRIRQELKEAFEAELQHWEEEENAEREFESNQSKDQLNSFLHKHAKYQSRATKRGICLPAEASRTDDGYFDNYRGWYDVQGCGKCNDYCRWVGGSGSGGNPQDQLVHVAQQGSWNSLWSCRLAGSTAANSENDRFQAFDFPKCSGEGSDTPQRDESGCLPPEASRIDEGYVDSYRGWYDVQGCGKCNDYCRWVGGSGSGGDPQSQLAYVVREGVWKSWWSCRLGNIARTEHGHFQTFEFPRCSGEGVAAPKICLPPEASRTDDGYIDSYRGWYDVQGCGKCNDYCRWVGGSGSGGDPQNQLAYTHSWWSCRLAGSTAAGTANGHFTTFNFVKCSGEGTAAPTVPVATPYVPGQAGSSWTEEEVHAVRAKIHRVINEGSAVFIELGLQQPVEFWTSAPNAAKLLRLGFHDCLKYTDGTGGCDGCVEAEGIGARFDRSSLGQGQYPSDQVDDGHNNGLLPTLQVLEAVYSDRGFPKRTPLLSISLKQSGKSRADLWALAVMVAVEYSADANNRVCDDTSGCHQRHGETDCKVTLPAFSFKSGRKDCYSTNAEHLFYAQKSESHPNAQGNGDATLDFMKSDFGFDGRETVAIMGAHTLGRLHVTHSLFRYVWKARGGDLLNNMYYRNLAKKQDWYFPSDQPQSLCKRVGNESGQRPSARWVTHVRGDTVAGGPVQWLQEKLVCRNYDMSSPMPDTCATNDLQWKFVVGIDETMLSGDMGLYKQFDVDANGIPTGCKGVSGDTGFKDFNLDSWGRTEAGSLRNYHLTWSRIGGRKAEPACVLQTRAEPIGSDPLHKIVEEFADDGRSWLAAFVPALEKMLSNGYSSIDLTLNSGMSGFNCPLQDKWNWHRQYTCSPEIESH